MTGRFRKFAMSLVLQVFWDDNVSVVKNAVFPGGSSLSTQTYSSLADVQKFITLKPFIVSRRPNNRWKDQKVFDNSCIWFQVRFPSDKSRLCIFWLLLVVKSDLMTIQRCFRFDVLLVDLKITTFHDVPAAWCGVHHISVVVSFMWCDQSTYPKVWLPFLFNSHVFVYIWYFRYLSLNLSTQLSHWPMSKSQSPLRLSLSFKNLNASFSPTLRNCFSMELF
jgi:hypothetical protein